MTCCDHCLPAYDIWSAVRGAFWGGARISYPAGDRPEATAVRFDFFAPGSTAVAFSIAGAVEDGAAWIFSIPEIAAGGWSGYPAGIYSYRMLVTTIDGDIEAEIEGTWTIRA